MKKITIGKGFSCFNITQDQTSVFRDLYIHETLLVMVERGSKKINPESEACVNVNSGELLVFPFGQFITIENKTLSGQDYSAFGISYTNELVNQVFDPKSSEDNQKMLHVRSCPDGLKSSIENLKIINADDEMPDYVVKHRFMEPLIWLKSMGYEFPAIKQRDLECKIRDLIVSDTAKAWRSEDVAKTFAMSEATMRRHLQNGGTNFTTILQNVRLEKGLTMLQTTNRSITEVAYDCGFSSPSHFSQVFKERFHIRPSDIRS